MSKDLSLTSGFNIKNVLLTGSRKEIVFEQCKLVLNAWSQVDAPGAV